MILTQAIHVHTPHILQIVLRLEFIPTLFNPAARQSANSSYKSASLVDPLLVSFIYSMSPATELFTPLKLLPIIHHPHGQIFNSSPLHHSQQSVHVHALVPLSTRFPPRPISSPTTISSMVSVPCCQPPSLPSWRDCKAILPHILRIMAGPYHTLVRSISCLMLRDPATVLHGLPARTRCMEVLRVAGERSVKVAR